MGICSPVEFQTVRPSEQATTFDGVQFSLFSNNGTMVIFSRFLGSIFVPKHMVLPMRSICLAVVGLFVCCSLSNAQCNCAGQGASVVHQANYGTASSHAWPAASGSQLYRGYQSRSGVAQFTYYKTPVGSARGIPGQSVPVQTVVANFAPPSKLTGSGGQSVPRRTYRQPLFRRW